MEYDMMAENLIGSIESAYACPQNKCGQNQKKSVKRDLLQIKPVRGVHGLSP